MRSIAQAENTAIIEGNATDVLVMMNKRNIMRCLSPAGIEERLAQQFMLQSSFRKRRKSYC